MNNETIACQPIQDALERIANVSGAMSFAGALLHTVGYGLIAVGGPKAVSFLDTNNTIDEIEELWKQIDKDVKSAMADGQPALRTYFKGFLEKCERNLCEVESNLDQLRVQARKRSRLRNFVAPLGSLATRARRVYAGLHRLQEDFWSTSRAANRLARNAALGLPPTGLQSDPTSASQCNDERSLAFIRRGGIRIQNEDLLELVEAGYGFTGTTGTQSTHSSSLSGSGHLVESSYLDVETDRVSLYSCDGSEASFVTAVGDFDERTPTKSTFGPISPDAV